MRIHSSPSLAGPPAPLGREAPAEAIATTPPLLPTPSTLGDASLDVAALIVRAAHEVKRSARAAALCEEQAARAAEDALVSELRSKAKSVRDHAVVTAGLAMAGGAASVAGAGLSIRAAATASDGASHLPRSFAGEALSLGGRSTGDAAGIVRAFAEARGLKYDASAEASRSAAQRALRASESWQKDAAGTAELVTAALAFARDAERSRSETLLLAARRA